ncbi:MAG: hypothetical protein HYU99_01685 [Deltaproteobacteria bacterium]|nr:hypothetical protein [Deltaproteobacteria bacterium]
MAEVNNDGVTVRWDVNNDGLVDDLVFKPDSESQKIGRLLDQCHVRGDKTPACQAFISGQAKNTTWPEHLDHVSLNPATDWARNGYQGPDQEVLRYNYRGGYPSLGYRLTTAEKIFHATWRPGAEAIRSLSYTFEALPVTEKIDFVVRFLKAVKERNKNQIVELTDALLAIQNKKRKFFGENEASIHQTADKIENTKNENVRLPWIDFYWEKIYKDPAFEQFRHEALADIHRTLGRIEADDQPVYVEGHLASHLLTSNSPNGPSLLLEAGKNYALTWIVGHLSFGGGYIPHEFCEAPKEGWTQNLVCKDSQAAITGKLSDIVSAKFGPNSPSAHIFYGFEFGDERVYLSQESISVYNVKAAE